MKKKNGKGFELQIKIDKQEILEETFLYNIKNILEENEIEYLFENNYYIIEEGFFSNIKDKVASLGGETKFDPTRRKVMIGTGAIGAAGMSNRMTRNSTANVFNNVINSTEGVNNGLLALGGIQHYAGDNKYVQAVKNSIKNDASNGTSQMVKNIVKSKNNLQNYDGSQGGKYKVEDNSRRNFLKNSGKNFTVAAGIGASGIADKIKDKIANKINDGTVKNSIRNIMKPKINETLAKYDNSYKPGEVVENPSRRKFILNTPNTIRKAYRLVNPKEYVQSKKNGTYIDVIRKTASLK